MIIKFYIIENIHIQLLAISYIIHKINKKKVDKSEKKYKRNKRIFCTKNKTYFYDPIKSLSSLYFEFKIFF